MTRITQKEKVVRHLYANMGRWIPSYKLVKATTDSGFTGLQADRRAFEVAKLGYYDSEKARYIIESRRNGKYTEFRCAERIVKSPLQDIESKMEAYAQSIGL